MGGEIYWKVKENKYNENIKNKRDGNKNEKIKKLVIILDSQT